MKNLLTTAILLICPLFAFADGTHKETKQNQPNMVMFLTNARDTTYIVSDTVRTQYANNITNTEVRVKKYDTIYVDAATFTAIAENQEQHEREAMLLADAENDIDAGGGEDDEFGLVGEEGKRLYSDDSIQYAVPADDIYKIWSHETVNPYNVNISTIKDTVNFEMYDFTYPLVKPMHITSKFGYRRRRFHYGIDLKLEVGDTVVAPMSGMVRMVKDYGRRGYGKCIVIRHNNGFETIYGHLSNILVEENQMVSSGDIIALGGSTGRSTGSHLHWEFRYLGNAINPTDIIDFEKHAPIKDVYSLVPRKAFNHQQTTTGKGGAKYWVIKKGDTLGRIAQRTGTSVKRLCSLNGISAKTTLRLGRKIRYN